MGTLSWIPCYLSVDYLCYGFSSSPSNHATRELLRVLFSCLQGWPLLIASVFLTFFIKLYLFTLPSFHKISYLSNSLHLFSGNLLLVKVGGWEMDKGSLSGQAWKDTAESAWIHPAHFGFLSESTSKFRASWHLAARSTSCLAEAEECAAVGRLVVGLLFQETDVEDLGRPPDTWGAILASSWMEGTAPDMLFAPALTALPAGFTLLFRFRVWLWSGT